jgi:hypothetical protein
MSLQKIKVYFKMRLFLNTKSIKIFEKYQKTRNHKLLHFFNDLNVLLAFYKNRDFKIL